jgi:hypothetical protein
MSVRERSVMVAAICCKLEAMAGAVGGWEPAARRRSGRGVGAGVRRYQLMSARESMGGCGGIDLARATGDESESAGAGAGAT